MKSSNISVCPLPILSNHRNLNPKLNYPLISVPDFWMIKSAQNVIGSVMCCPGCFSLYRASAVRDIMENYAGPTESAFDVFIKDTGLFPNHLTLEKDPQPIHFQLNNDAFQIFPYIYWYHDHWPIDWTRYFQEIMYLPLLFESYFFLYKTNP